MATTYPKEQMHRIKYTKLTPEQVLSKLKVTDAGPTSTSPLSNALAGKSMTIKLDNGPTLSYKFTDGKKLTLKEDAKAAVNAGYGALELKSLVLFSHLIPGTPRGFHVVVDRDTNLATAFESWFNGYTDNREVQREFYFGYVDQPGKAAPTTRHTLTNRVEGKGMYWKQDNGVETLEFYPSTQFSSFVELTRFGGELMFCAPSDYVKVNDHLFLYQRTECEFSGTQTLYAIDLFKLEQVGTRLGFDETDKLEFYMFQGKGDITGQLATFQAFGDNGDTTPPAPARAVPASAAAAATLPPGAAGGPGRGGTPGGPGGPGAGAPGGGGRGPLTQNVAPVASAPMIAESPGRAAHQKGQRNVYRPLQSFPKMTDQQVETAVKTHGPNLFGASQMGGNKPPVSKALVGKAFTLRFDSGNVWEYKFDTIDTLHFRKEGESAWHEEKYETYEPADNLFVFAHIRTGTRESGIFVVDMDNQLTTCVNGHLGSDYYPNEVSQHIIMGVIDEPGKVMPKYNRHRFTDELCGHAVTWNYGGTLTSMHIYGTPRSASWVIFQGNGNGGSEWSSPANYVKLRDDCYLFSWIEESCNGSQGTIVFNERTMHNAGFGFSGGQNGLSLSAIGAYARLAGHYDIRKYYGPKEG